jgi:hypothetical protein
MEAITKLAEVSTVKEKKKKKKQKNLKQAAMETL